MASISLIGSESSDVTTFPVVVNVTGESDRALRRGECDVSIIVKQLNDVTEVPTGAISYGTNGQATVTRWCSGAHVAKDVTVGTARRDETQITAGVSAGDKVLEKEITFKAPGGGTRRRPLRRRRGAAAPAAAASGASVAASGGFGGFTGGFGGGGGAGG